VGGQEPAILCRGLSRSFRGRDAVSGLDLEVPPGSVFGFLGPNGAGKTTTVRMMLGLLPPSAGSLRVLGFEPLTEGGRIRAATGVVLDQVGLYDRLTAWQNLEFAARVARLGSAGRAVRVEAALRRVDLWDRRADRVSGFSKGMRQKLGLARALLGDPALLVLDEPTSGLDPASIVMVRDLIVSLAQEGGRTIFLCTHHLDEAQRVCSLVGILQAGRLIALGSPGELGAAPQATVRIRCARLDAGALRLPPGCAWAGQAGPGEWRVTLSRPEDAEALVAALVAADAGVRAVIPEQRSLEDVYLAAVGGQGHG
jgi:ABC-2 type transport system ATP-binding protein